MRLLALLLLALPAVASAQYAVSSGRVTAGAATSSGGIYALTGNAGVPEAGTMSGGAFKLSGGILPSGPGAVGVDDPPARPLAFALHRALPNPTTASTTLRFDLPRAATASLVVYDAAGRAVRTLVRGAQTAGAHLETWDGTDDAGRALGAGVYFARLEAAGLSARQRIVLLR